jgi:hypothetical protein
MNLSTTMLSIEHNYRSIELHHAIVDLCTVVLYSVERASAPPRVVESSRS